MARKNKLKKFDELSRFPHVFENFESKDPKVTDAKGKTIELKGNWNNIHFKNSNPIVVELACGRGEYTIALAERYPNKNFIGVDIKGARIWKGAKYAIENGLENVAFLRTRIEFINAFFGENEVDEIWITFPDPFIRKSKANRRLTSPHFIDKYRKFLKRNGLVHLKTDADSLYEYSRESFAGDKQISILIDDKDIYDHDLIHPDLEFKTYYEKMHLEDGRIIKYLQFRIFSP